jgi:tRNA A-37 threonylcarbamoyl transferase component Bud32
MTLPITRSFVAQYHPVLLARGNSFVQADIYKIHYNGHTIILKDFSERPWIIRVSIGRFLLNREVTALKRLANIQNVPAYLGMVDKYAFVMEHIEGSRLPRKKSAPPDVDLFSNLQALVDTIHTCGVAHNDLRRTNILINLDGIPYLIDFATAVFQSASKGLTGVIKNAIFSRCTHMDRLKCLKLKHQYYPHLITEEEQRMLQKKPMYLKCAEFFRKEIYRTFFKPARWKERIQRVRSKNRVDF